MSSLLSWYIIFIVAINIIGCVALLYFTRKKKAIAAENETTGHVYDGIEEYDKPMPRWWLIMFYITIVFGVIYLVLYPGLGAYQGVLGWSQEGQYEEQVADADARYLPLFREFAAVPIEELLDEPRALKMGQTIFVNTCFGCHGSDARGAPGYPNLTDDAWLYGGHPEAIKTSIAKGRMGVMTGWKDALGDDGLRDVTNYVLSLNEVERRFDRDLASQGESQYQQICAACHGPDGKGNQALGAPDLTDAIWLYGGSYNLIRDTIAYGRQGVMPAHDEILSPEKIHLVAAYVYSLSHEQADASAESGEEEP